MRKLALAITLTFALLGAIGLGSARSLSAAHPAAAHAAHTPLMVDGSPTPDSPVCPGGGSGSCG